jgi:anti-sigma regulatory factor (Ser/Thr protein kinase)
LLWYIAVKRIAGFRLKASVKDLAKVRRFITQTGAAKNVDPSAIYDINLAVTELITNTLNYGYRRQKGLFEIEINQADGDLFVHLRDEAPAFDPTQTALQELPDLSLSLDRRPLGKMGIYLTQRSVDQFTHREIPGGGNEIILRKINVFASHQQEDTSHGIKD